MGGNIEFFHNNVAILCFLPHKISNEIFRFISMEFLFCLLRWLMRHISFFCPVSYIALRAIALRATHHMKYLNIQISYIEANSLTHERTSIYSHLKFAGNILMRYQLHHKEWYYHLHQAIYICRHPFLYPTYYLIIEEMRLQTSMVIDRYRVRIVIATQKYSYIFYSEENFHGHVKCINLAIFFDTLRFLPFL